MIRALGVGVLLFAATSVAAQEFPRFDIEATCRAAPRLLPTDPSPYQSCMRDEARARGQLERQWASVSTGQRDECVRASSVGGTPSFVDVLTCIQMASGVPVLFPPVIQQ